MERNNDIKRGGRAVITDTPDMLGCMARFSADGEEYLAKSSYLDINSDFAEYKLIEDPDGPSPALVDYEFSMSASRAKLAALIDARFGEGTALNPTAAAMEDHTPLEF